MNSTDTTTHTFDVECGHLWVMDSKVAELAKVAKRYGLEAPTYRVLSTRVEVVDGLPVEMATVEVTERRLVLDGGWTFVALIDHTEVGNIVRAAPGIDDDLSAFQSVDGTCDHCGKVRNRTKTLVVKDETGKVVRIGKACAKVYLPSWKLPLTDAVSDFLSAMSNAWREITEGGRRQDLTTNEILEVAIRVVATFGYRSKANAQPELGLMSTSRLVEDVMSVSTADDVKEMREQIKETPVEVVELMKAGIVDYAERLSAAAADGTIDTFGNNQRVALHVGGLKNLGLLCWTVESVRRDVEKCVAETAKAAANAERPNEWIGSVGSKITVSGTCVQSRAVETVYGVSFLVVIETPAGVVKAFTTAQGIPELGDQVTVTAKVKDHEFYNGTKQTAITRPKFAIA